MSTVTATRAVAVYAVTGPSIRDSHRPGLSMTIVLGGDVLGLSLILWAFLGNTPIGRYAAPGGWLALWPILPLVLVLYAFFHSYPGISVNPIDEIRCISLSAFLSASALILLIRALVRKLGSKFAWWGFPVVLFGGGAAARSLLRKLKSQPQLGLDPIAVVADQVDDIEMDGVPIYKSIDVGHIASSRVKHAIVAAPELSRSEFAEVVGRGRDTFQHLILIPDADSIWTIGSYTRDLTGLLGLQVRNNLLDGGSRIAKRMIDVACATVLILLLLPLLAIISVLIVVESGLPIFYFDKRFGHGGATFQMWKFRTMARNSAEVLDRYLASSSELRKEWAEFQKLRNDPRITRVGRVLRKTSMDELPQLWNVIMGEMSLVGPRPRLMEAAVAKYQEANSVYAKTTPGLTGLWQVSGRNRTTYEERIDYDAYYIRNWSVWMDIYLLAKTVGAVLTGDGAY